MFSTRRVSLAALSLALLACLTVGAAPLAAGPAEAFTVRSAQPFDGAALARERAELHAQLVAEQAAPGLDRPILVRVGAEERALLASPATGERKLLVGISKPVGAAFDFAGLDLAAGTARTMPYGAVRPTADGGFVWSARVRAEGATAVRLRLTGLALPRGYELYVYNPGGQAFGPYRARGTGELWSHTLFGPEAIVQLRHRPAAADRTAGAPAFRIEEVGYVGPRFLLPARLGWGAEFGEAFCSFNEPCVLNAECPGTDPAVNAARDAVAHILFPSGGFLYICSGGLLADTDAMTDRPLFLTANHCISKNNEATGMEAFFQFTTPCGDACYDPEGVVPSTLGAVILSKGKRSDYTLMELNEPAPGGSAFLGWNSTAVAFTNGMPLYRISHPAGAPQAYSAQQVDTTKGTCGGWPRGNYIYSTDTVGGTEGGSSGSPVVNGAGQVVGQLTGACGTNVGDPCDAESNATVDGAFAAYFSAVQPILDPNPSCAPAGASCTVDADCCSNKCKGPPGGKTCR